MSPDIQERIEHRLKLAGAVYGTDQVNKLSAYFGLLAKWNARMNLTSLSMEPVTDDAIDRLIVEPTLAAANIKTGDESLIDLGSGGGSPAIPLTLATPWLRLVMVESKARKAAFLRDACRQLELVGVEVLNVRFEELRSSLSHLRSADLVSVRAVKANTALWGVARALIRPGGRVFWFTATPGAPAAAGFKVVRTDPLTTVGSYLLILQEVAAPSL